MLREAQRTLDDLKKVGNAGASLSSNGGDDDAGAGEGRGGEGAYASASAPAPAPAPPIPFLSSAGLATSRAADGREEAGGTWEGDEGRGGVLPGELAITADDLEGARSGSDGRRSSEGSGVQDSRGSGAASSRSGSWNSGRGRRVASPLIFGDHSKDFVSPERTGRAVEKGAPLHSVGSSRVSPAGAGVGTLTIRGASSATFATIGGSRTSSAVGGPGTFASVGGSCARVSGANGAFASTGGVGMSHAGPATSTAAEGVGKGFGASDPRQAERKGSPPPGPRGPGTGLAFLASAPSTPLRQRGGSDRGSGSVAGAMTPLPDMPPRLVMAGDEEEGDYSTPPEMDRLATAGRKGPAARVGMGAEAKIGVKGKLPPEGRVRNGPGPGPGARRKWLGGKDEYALVAAGVE